MRRDNSGYIVLLVFVLVALSISMVDAIGDIWALQTRVTKLEHPSTTTTEVTTTTVEASGVTCVIDGHKVQMSVQSAKKAGCI